MLMPADHFAAIFLLGTDREKSYVAFIADLAVTSFAQSRQCVERTLIGVFISTLIQPPRTRRQGTSIA